MSPYQFILNSKDPLSEAHNPFPELCDAFLLSEHYATASQIKKFITLKAQGNLIISDNGNFTRMGKIASKFAAKGEEIVNLAENEYKKLGKVSESTLQLRHELMQAIIQECIKQQNLISVAKITAKQLKYLPDIFIGMEDFTIPVLSMAGMFDYVFPSNALEIIPYQKATQQLFSLQANGQFGHQKELKNTNKYIVYHANDYTSAYQAAAMDATIEKQGIAISFGGPMSNNNYIKSIEIAGKTEVFDELLPESYLSSIALVLGTINGDKTDNPIHILGLGTPILITLLGYTLRGSKKVTIDSTATFKDADDGKLYSSTNSFLKMDMYKVAALALIDDIPYTSSSPWFQHFNEKHPSDWKALQTALGVTPSTKFNELAVTLKASSPLLEKYIPFFMQMRSGRDTLIKDVRMARTGTNYWAIKKATEKISELRNNENELKTWTENEIEKYSKLASPKFAKAVLKMYEFSCMYSFKL